ncbi:MAG: pilus assembly protein [Planctomycetota bacterium]|nr:MAG: pilus assembly protein [Planctomycetota bacterium]
MLHCVWGHFGISLMMRSRLRTDFTFSDLPNRRGRRGVVIVELLIWLPVLMTALMAVVEFAIMQQVNQQVALASRYGAKIAAEVTRDTLVATNLTNINQNATSNNLKSRIDTFLANAGLTGSCEVRLEHNASVGGKTQVDTATVCPCSATGPGTLPAGESPPGEAYVRVTVCVSLTGNVPNLLSTLGYDITGLIARHSTTYRVETNS